MDWIKVSVIRMMFHYTASVIVATKTRTPAFWNTPCRPMITHSSDPHQGSNSWSRPTTGPVYTVRLDNQVWAQSPRLVAIHEPGQWVRLRSHDLNDIGSVYYGGACTESCMCRQHWVRSHCRPIFVKSLKFAVLWDCQRKFHLKSVYILKIVGYGEKICKTKMNLSIFRLIIHIKLTCPFSKCSIS